MEASKKISTRKSALKIWENITEKLMAPIICFLAYQELSDSHDESGPPGWPIDYWWNDSGWDPKDISLLALLSLECLAPRRPRPQEQSYLLRDWIPLPMANPNLPALRATLRAEPLAPSYKVNCILTTKKLKYIREIGKFLLKLRNGRCKEMDTWNSMLCLDAKRLKMQHCRVCGVLGQRIWKGKKEEPVGDYECQVPWLEFYHWRQLRSNWSF